MSRNRLTFSRPRTKVYDANYSMGESYYKSALDGIDRKYGRVGSAEPSLRASLERPLAEVAPPPPSAAAPRSRDLESEEFFEDFGKRKAQTAAMMSEFDSLFESRMKNGVSGKERSTASVAMKAMEDEVEEDLAASMKRLKAVRASRAAAEDAEIGRSKMNFSDKIMESVGLSGKARSALEEEALAGSRRILKITTTTTTTESGDGGDVTRWTALKSGAASRRSALDEEETESAAAARARRSRARLDDLEAEMQAITERGAAREKRARDLRALVEENEASSMDNLQSTMRIKSSLQSEKKMVSF